MTALPPAPLSRLEGTEEDEDLFQESSVKKSLQNAFDTPVVVKKRISRLSQNFQQLPVEYMKVFLRLRPFTEKELKENEGKRTMRISDDKHILTAMAPKDSKTFKTSSRGIGEPVRHFTFTKIFDHTTGQKEFYTETAHPLVQDFIDGNNALIFTYGVTNAGKTYTIQGSPGNEGIIPQAIEYLFTNVGDKIMEDVKFQPKMAHNLRLLEDEEKITQNAIKEKVLAMADESRFSFGQASDATLESSVATEMTNTSAEDTLSTSSRPQSMEGLPSSSTDNIDEPVKYAVFVSFVEVYKEITYDLLTDFPKEKKHSRQELVIADDGKGASYVKGMREIQVNSPDEVMKILSVGRRNLHVAATNLNKDSSRSHCIFTITLVQVKDIPDPNGGRVSKISFCDLAGSERANKTKEVGDRLKEAGKINTSLMKLGMCIEALRHNQQHRDDKQKQRVVSFRDSKLTRLFRSYLLGKGRACMIVNANMCASGFDETAHVLKFSAIAKEIQIINNPKRNLKVKSRATLFEEKFETSTEAVKKPRATIAWERKLTPVKDLNENPEEDEEVEDSEEESEEFESDSESDNEENMEERDVAYWKKREKRFLELIQMMKKALSQEQKNSKEREARARSQIMQQMQNQIVQIEKSHENQMEDTINILQEEEVKRLDIMKDMATADLNGLKKRLDKKYWEVTAKNTQMEQELAECKEQLKAKTTELQTAEDKITSSELNINMLQMEIKEKAEEITTLKQRHRRSSRRYSNTDKDQFILDLEKKNEEGRFIIEELMEEVDKHKSKVEEEQEKNNKLNEDLVSANKRIEELSNADKTQLSDVDNKELERLTEEHKNLLEKISHLEESSSQLRAKLEIGDELVKDERPFKDTQCLFDHLPAWINNKEETINNLTSQLETEKCEKTHTQNELSSSSAQIVQLTSQTEALTDQLNQKTVDHEELGKKNEEMQASHTQEIQNLENELNRLKKESKTELDNLKDKLKEAGDKITELEKELAESKKFEQQLMKETDRLHGEVEQLKKENSQVKQTSMKRTSDASELKQDVAILTQDRNDLLVRVENLQKSLDETKKEKVTLEEELRENLANTTSVQLNTELSELKSSLSEKETTIQKLQSENEDLVTKSTNLQEALSCSERKFEDEQNRMKAEIDRIGKENEEMKKLKKNLEDSLDEQRKQSTKLQKDVENITVECNSFSIRVNDLQNNLQENNKEKLTLEQNIKSLREKLEIKNEEHIVLSKECSQFKESILSLEKKVQELQTEKEFDSKSSTDFKASQAHFVKQLEEKQNEYNRLEAEFNEYRAKSNHDIENMKEEFKNEKEVHEKEMKELEKQDEKVKSDIEKSSAKLKEELEQKQAELRKLEKDFKNFEKNSEKEMAALKKKMETQITNSKDQHKKEIKQLETKNAKAIESKDKELTKFRENRDRIVAALEIQIKNDKSTNELLKTNLDEQMAENVHLKSQNAAALAQNTDLKAQLEKSSQKQSLNKSVSASAVVNMDAIVRVKSEPMSPPQQPQIVVSPLKRRADNLSPLKDNGGGESHSAASETELLPVPSKASVRKTSSTRGARGRKRGGSTGSRTSSRRTKRVTGRPATPLPDVSPADDDEEEETKDNDDDKEESIPSPKKSRRATRKASVKTEVPEEQGVLDDSELLRETGNSRNFPQPTMELDVTPQVKKIKKTQKRRVTKKDDQDHESEDAEGGTLKTGRSLRAKTRGGTNNANNSNNSKTSDEDTASLLSVTASKNLTKVGDMLKNSPVGQAFKAAKDAIGPAVKSPKKTRKQPDEQKKTRRMVKLHTDDISLPLEATPSPEHIRDTATSRGVGETPARMIRRLRNRK